MDLKGSFLCSQDPATGPYSEPDVGRLHLSKLFPQDLLLVIGKLKYMSGGGLEVT